jgi:hypothetical protein
MATPTVLEMFLIACLGSLWGCSQKPDPQRFVPAPEVARQAVESVLSSWKEGQPVGLIADTTPQVHITDSHRKQGQKLNAYRILGEVPGNAPRCFAVKLTYSHPTAEERARFVVLGIDPLWVFRHEDLDFLSHWDHPMEENKKSPADAKPLTATDSGFVPEPLPTPPQSTAPLSTKTPTAAPSPTSKD